MAQKCGYSQRHKEAKHIPKQRFEIHTCIKMARWHDFTSNRILREITGTHNVTCQLKKKILSWLGHIMRKDRGHLLRKSLDWHPAGKRKPQGR
jgi:hypothetical protein